MDIVPLWAVGWDLLVKLVYLVTTLEAATGSFLSHTGSIQPNGATQTILSMNFKAGLLLIALKYLYL